MKFIINVLFKMYHLGSGLGMPSSDVAGTVPRNLPLDSFNYITLQVRSFRKDSYFSGEPLFVVGEVGYENKFN